MKSLAEILVIIAIMITAWPLDMHRFVILTGLLLVVYGMTIWNSYKDGFDDGYKKAIDDRIY